MFVRVRPPLDQDGGEKALCLSTDDANRAIILKSKPEPKVFTFDQVADIYTTQVCLII